MSSTRDKGYGGDRGSIGGRGDRGQRGPDKVVVPTVVGGSSDFGKCPDHIRKTDFFFMYPELNKALRGYSDDVSLMVTDIFRRIVKINQDIDVACSKRELHSWLSEGRLDIVRYHMEKLKALKDPVFEKFINDQEPELERLEGMLSAFPSSPELLEKWLGKE